MKVEHIHLKVYFVWQNCFRFYQLNSDRHRFYKLSILNWNIINSETFCIVWQHNWSFFFLFTTLGLQTKFFIQFLKVITLESKHEFRFGYVHIMTLCMFCLIILHDMELIWLRLNQIPHLNWKSFHNVFWHINITNKHKFYR